jgi:EmrB/QacA subfamily drug resistance transporter
VTSRRVAVVFVGLQIGMIVSTLDGTIVATALPTIARDVGAEAQRSWVITAYLLGQVATMPLYGKLGDLFGRKQLYLFALTLFTAASLCCGAAQTLGQLVAFRAVQGVGAGGLGTLAMAVLGDIVPSRQLGRWLGYQGALFAAASLVGPFTGGLFVDHLSWRWAFFVNLPLAAVSVTVVALALRLPYRRIPHAIDYAGAALLTATLVAVVLLASVGGEVVGWTSPAVAALAAAVVVLVALFARRERLAAEPVVPLHLFRSPISRVTAGTNFTSGALFASGIYFLPVFWQQVAGVSPTRSGLLLVPFMFTTAGATLVAGRMVERSGRYRAWPIAGGCCMTLGVVLLATLDRDSSVAVAAAFGAVLGTGVGFVMQTSLLALQNSVDHADLGVATSSALLARILGSTVGAALLSAVLEAGLPADGTRGAGDYAGAIRAVYLAALPVALGAIALALRLQERPLREDARFDAVELAP